MSDNNGYMLPENTLLNDPLPNRLTLLERPRLCSAVHGFWLVE
jgi:hypothetical protein